MSADTAAFRRYGLTSLAEEEGALGGWDRIAG
jgi:hypothetical protein